MMLGQADRPRGQPFTAAVPWPDLTLLTMWSLNCFTSSPSQAKKDKAVLFLVNRRQDSKASACLAPLHIPNYDHSPGILPDESPRAKGPPG